MNAISTPTPSQAQIAAIVQLYNQGNFRDALQRGEALAQQYPDAPFLLNLLGIVNARLGNFAAAIQGLSKAIQLKPDYAEAYNNLGNALNHSGRHQEAILNIQQALKVRPNFVEALRCLGHAQSDLGQFDAAIASFFRALELEPNHAYTHNDIGSALMRIDKFEEAAVCFNRAIELKPNYARAHVNLGNLLRDNRRKPDAAVVCYQRAIAIDPDFAEAHVNLGDALRSLGRVGEAIASYDRAVELKPDYVEAHTHRSALQRYEEGDPAIECMVDLLAQADRSDEERMYLNFALGKVQEDLANYDGAFAYFVEGNRLRRQRLSYELAADRKLCADLAAAFVSELPEMGMDGYAADTNLPRPVFVVGMPRSGTSLVEQILASHSQVYGAGELGLLERSIHATDWRSARLSENQLRSVRAAYAAGLQLMQVSEPFLTDKNPLNFWWIGFICAAMPEARVVHVARDPRATCWSNYKHCFASDVIRYAYDLEAIADYYQLYVELMGFWRQKFPGRIYDLSYERLTEDQEGETRRLLEYVGLGWEAQCLNFHETERAVQTTSSLQVRQKLFQGSSDSWQNYAAHLQPLVERLRHF